jgi:hypothetical protein
MSSPVVVFTTEKDNPERGEIKRFDNLQNAQRFVELLIEQGVPSETLQVFKVAEVPVVVTYRPVVSLSAVIASPEDPPGEDEPTVSSTPPERRPYEKNGERLSAVLPSDADR